jgi:hypothetical protein
MCAGLPVETGPHSEKGQISLARFEVEYGDIKVRMEVCLNLKETKFENGMLTQMIMKNSVFRLWPRETVVLVKIYVDTKAAIISKAVASRKRVRRMAEFIFYRMSS